VHGFFAGPTRGPRAVTPRTFVFVLLLAAALLAARPWSRPPVSDPAGRTPCPVLGITDGDTLRVEYQGREERIRLLRINTPERGAPGAQQATELLRGVIPKDGLSL